MIIVNADDFGRSRAETDVVMACFRAGRVTSTTAMMFMEDSERAADLVEQHGLDVGLHLNLSQKFTARGVGDSVRRSHDRVVGFLTTSKYAVLLYNPLLRRQFRDVVAAQIDEFARIYGRAPSHIDGHQHQHLCANVLIDQLLPAGQRVRRSFSFWRGEKGGLNRGYRAVVDRLLVRRYHVADYFFSLQQCLAYDRMARVFELARTGTVELMTHPVNAAEYQYLMSEAYSKGVAQLNLGTYAAVGS
jgi:predicted glycoside hydrolase/deacetylase ChbG (UPF0249 family)